MNNTSKNRHFVWVKGFFLHFLLIVFSVANIHATVLWEGDPALGFKVFEGTENYPGCSSSMATDPKGLYGQVFSFHIGDDPADPGYKDRSEVKGSKQPNGSNFRVSMGQSYYLGWRSLWEPMHSESGKWIALFQIHGYGQTGCGAPLVLKTSGDGKLRLVHESSTPGEPSVDVWVGPFVTGQWQSFVVHFNVVANDPDGFLEFWYNGVKQVLTNGKTNFPAAMWNCSYIAQKWGIYRTGALHGEGVAYLWRPRYATTYDEAAPPDAPKAPSNLTATTISSSQADLFWIDNSIDEANFRVEHSTDSIHWVTSTTLPANTTAYSCTGLLPITKHYFRVLALDNLGKYNSSNIANATTLNAVPIAPSGLSATPVSIDKIMLQWNDNSNNEDTFRIERSIDDGSNWSLIKTIGKDTATYTDSGLTVETSYTYRVRAGNVLGSSSWSNTSNASISATAPAAPGNIFLTVISISQIRIKWTDNSTNEANFRIERSIDGGSTYSFVANANANDTVFTDNGLSTSIDYYYRLRAENTYGISTWASPEHAVIPPIPAVPGNLTATGVSSTSINIAWVDNSNVETAFRIEKSTDDGANWTFLTSLAANTVTYTDNGLITAKIYYYRIRSENISGSSAYSNFAYDTTLRVPPSAPSALTASTTSGSEIDLAWNDNSNNEDQFRIERSANGTSSFQFVANVGANATTYTDNTGLIPYTTYFYRVRAENTAGSSTYSSNAYTIAYADIDTAVYIWKEAESGALTAPMQSVADNTASRGNYIVVSTGTSSSGSVPTTGVSTINFHVTVAGTYLIWGRAIEPNTSTNSFWIKIDEGTAIKWSDDSQVSTTWQWSIMRNADKGLSIVTTNLTPGTHTITIIYREINTRLDKILITNDFGYKPEDLGGINSPSNPGTLVANTVSASQINLSWADNSDNEDNFKVESSKDGTNWSPLATVATNVTNFSNSGLNTKTKYYYRVYAINSAENSGYSNIANATTLDVTPMAPANLTATTISTKEIDLAWTDNSGNEDNFRIERSPDGTAWISLITLAYNTTSYSDTGLNANTKYYYHVLATNQIGSASYSNTAFATTANNVVTEVNDMLDTKTPQSYFSVSLDNGTVKLNYKLSGSTHLIITVNDVNGRKIGVITNKHQEAGEHTLTWETSDLSQGVYFINIVTNNFSKTMKILLSK